MAKRYESGQKRPEDRRRKVRQPVTVAGLPGTVFYMTEWENWSPGFLPDNGEDVVELPGLCIEVRRDDGVTIWLDVQVETGIDAAGVFVPPSRAVVTRVVVEGGDLTAALPRLNWSSIVALALADFITDKHEDGDPYVFRPPAPAVRAALALIGDGSPVGGRRVRDDDLPVVAAVWRAGGARAVEEQLAIPLRTVYRLADRCVTAELLTPAERGGTKPKKTTKGRKVTR